MADYDIGLSGLSAAQKAFSIIGNNIANAATEGYHRQQVELSPAYSQHPGSTTFVGGVNYEGATRMIDMLLEQEILRQKSVFACVSQESGTLSTIEAAIGEFTSDESGLNAAIDSFFISLQNLNANPTGDIWQNQVVSDAETMAAQFRSLGDFLTILKNQVKLDAENTIENINTLTGQIADLNGKIEKIVLIGGDVNNLSDHRDQLISELSELIAIEATQTKNGVFNISASGLSMVTGSFSSALVTGYNENGQLGLAIEGGTNYSADISGGKTGGLLSVYNGFITDFTQNLNSLATTLIQEINRYHVMGIGSAGSFTQLSGDIFASENLSETGFIQDGSFYIRVTNTGTGEVTRHAIAVDAANDTLTDIATLLSPITGITASVNSSNQLSIASDPNYTFDFLPCALSEPTFVDFNDAAAPSVTVTGTYTGSENDTLEFQVTGDGAVGNGTLLLEVYNGTGGLLRTLNIGSGYAAGDRLEIGNGVEIALTAGNLAQSNGDFFQVDVFANTDTAGFLSAVGLNTFFSGNSALNMNVCSEISDNPKRIAASLGSEAADNGNIRRMASLKENPVSSLGGLSCGEFYRKVTAGMAQELSVRKMQQDSVEVVLLNLENRKSDISGVDINEQAALLLVFEQMFQSMAEYMSTIKTSVESLMNIL